jgi:hypothetical protein
MWWLFSRVMGMSTNGRVARRPFFNVGRRAGKVATSVRGEERNTADADSTD